MPRVWHMQSWCCNALICIFGASSWQKNMCKCEVLRLYSDLELMVHCMSIQYLVTRDTVRSGQKWHWLGRWTIGVENEGAKVNSWCDHCQRGEDGMRVLMSLSIEILRTIAKVLQSIFLSTWGDKKIVCYYYWIVELSKQSDPKEMTHEPKIGWYPVVHSNVSSLTIRRCHCGVVDDEDPLGRCQGGGHGWVMMMRRRHHGMVGRWRWGGDTTTYPIYPEEDAHISAIAELLIVYGCL